MYIHMYVHIVHLRNASCSCIRNRPLSTDAEIKRLQANENQLKKPKSKSKPNPRRNETEKPN